MQRVYFGNNLTKDLWVRFIPYISVPSSYLNSLRVDQGLFAFGKYSDLLNIPKPNVSQKPLGCVVLVSGLPQKVNRNKTGVNVIRPSTVC